MSIRIKKIGAKYMKALVYAPWGVGKTLFGCSASTHPDMGPVLLVNIEGGGVTASGFDNIQETEQLGSFQDVTEVFWNLANETEEDGVDWGAFKTIVIDSGSALQDMNIMEVATDNASARKKALQISQQDWGISTRMCGELLRKFKSLPKHVIVTARQRDGFPEGMDDAKKALMGPSVSVPDFTPALRRAVNHTFDHVWAMTADDDGQRWLLTEDSGPYRAKTRGPAFQKALGATVKLKNPSEPDSEGHTLGSIFDLYQETQGQK